MGMMMSTKEAAEYIGVSPATIRQYVHENGMPVLKFPGRKKWLFRKDLIDQWIEEQSTPQMFVEKEMNVNRLNFEPNIKERFPNVKSEEKGKLRMLLP